MNGSTVPLVTVMPRDDGYVEITESWNMVGSSPNRFRPDASVDSSNAAVRPATYTDIFNNPLHFPPFDQLLCDDVGSLSGSYAHTWCFVGEITWDQPDIGEYIRKGAMVTDRDGKCHIPIYYYPKTGRFDYDTLKIGHTFCAMLAQQHHFLDMSTGLRIEDLDLVKVIPCSLDNLFAISTRFSKCADVSCWGCGETPAAGLKKCVSCGVACYCGKDCQTKDWKECHKKWCKAIPEFIKLTKVDYEAKPDYYALVTQSGERLW